MINFDEIKNTIQKKELTIFECETPEDILVKGFKFDTLEKLMDFCNKLNINICFVDAKYTNVDDYKITNELIDEMIEVNSIALKHRILDQIREYNHELLIIDDSNPTEVVVAALYQSNYFYFYQQKELLFEGDIILDPEDKLEKILEMFESELEEEREEFNSIIEQQILKLKEFVLNDPDFQYCTNKELRRDYTRKLFKTRLGKEFKELKQYWSNPEIPAFVYRGAINMIELLWKQLKDNK